MINENDVDYNKSLQEQLVQSQIDILNKFMKAIYKYELTHDYAEGSLSKPILKIFEELQLKETI